MKMIKIWSYYEKEQSVVRVQSFKMRFLFRLKRYFIVVVISKTERFLDIVRRSSDVFCEPGFNYGRYNILLHELRWLFVLLDQLGWLFFFLLLCHPMGHVIEGILPIDVYTHQAGSVWFLLDLLGDTHKIIRGVFWQIGGDDFLCVGGILGFGVDAGRS